MILAALFTLCQPLVTDGDSIRDRCTGERIRLVGIDAPEMGHCRRGRTCAPGNPHASKAALARMVASGPVQCERRGLDRYRRTLAACSVGGRDLGAAMLAGGYAVRWPVRGGR